MRKQPVALKHHIGGPLLRPYPGNVDAFDFDPPCARRDESGDHAQQRGLPAPRRPENGTEIASDDLEINGFYGGDIAIGLGEPRKNEQRWAVALHCVVSQLFDTGASQLSRICPTLRP